MTNDSDENLNNVLTGLLGRVPLTMVCVQHLEPPVPRGEQQVVVLVIASK
jgi:hypothetical protein